MDHHLSAELHSDRSAGHRNKRGRTSSETQNIHIHRLARRFEQVVYRDSLKQITARRVQIEFNVGVIVLTISKSILDAGRSDAFAEEILADCVEDIKLQGLAACLRA